MTCPVCTGPRPCELDDAPVVELLHRAGAVVRPMPNGSLRWTIGFRDRAIYNPFDALSVYLAEVALLKAGWRTKATEARYYESGRCVVAGIARPR